MGEVPLVAEVLGVGYAKLGPLLDARGDTKLFGCDDIDRGEILAVLLRSRRSKIRLQVRVYFQASPQIRLKRTPIR